MPEVVSKIPIGFNLEGYDFFSSSNTAAGTFGAGGAGGSGGSGGVNAAWGGVNAAWGGGLVDDRWVADDSLKQVQFEGTQFQSVPMVHINSSGEKEYAIMSDSTGFVDGVGLEGGGAFAASIYADCRLSNTEVLNKWGEQNKRYHGGSSDDFTCGVAICPITVADYLNHFYNLGISKGKAEQLCKTHALCVEVLYNTGESQGKAFRLKVVDSSGNAGYKGSMNYYGKWRYTYDVLDTMTAVLLTPGFEDVVSLNKSKLGVVNSSELYFPWKDQKYDYRTARIPGYSPSQLLSLGLKDSQQKVSPYTVAWKSFYTAGVGKHAVSRGRFFAEESDKDKVKQVIPNIPDDFFKTNYADGATADYSVNTSLDLSQASGANQRILITAQAIEKVIAQTHFAYGNGLFVANTSGTGLKYNSKNNTIDCDTFVDWVLTEAGVKSGPAGSIGGSRKAASWDAGVVNQQISQGYKAVEVGVDITKAAPGDILIWGKNGKSHAGIFGGMQNGACTEHGMGWWTYTGREVAAPHNPTTPKAQPHGSMTTSDLTHIIRICNA